MPGNGRVFISHAHSDNDRCAPILAALHAWGVDFWFDAQNMDAGQDLSASIQRAIEERDIFIRIGTPAAQASYWVRLETGAFRGLQAQEHREGTPDRRTLINIIMDPAYKREPFDFATLFIDATAQPLPAWQGELRRALGVAAPAPTKEVSPAPIPAQAPSRPSAPDWFAAPTLDASAPTWASPPAPTTSAAFPRSLGTPSSPLAHSTAPSRPSAAPYAAFAATYVPLTETEHAVTAPPLAPVKRTRPRISRPHISLPRIPLNNRALAVISALLLVVVTLSVIVSSGLLSILPGVRPTTPTDGQAQHKPTATTTATATRAPTATPTLIPTSTPPPPPPNQPFTFVSPDAFYSIQYFDGWGAFADGANSCCQGPTDEFPGPGQERYAVINWLTKDYAGASNDTVVDNADYWLAVQGGFTQISRDSVSVGGETCRRGTFTSNNGQFEAWVLGCHHATREYMMYFRSSPALWANDVDAYFTPMLSSLVWA